MGRELKRVPLDFDWPLRVKWTGYLNPFRNAESPCHDCDGTGYGPEAKRFHDQWYGNAPFDAAAYGATPITIDHPRIEELAVRNIEAAPDFYSVRELGRYDAILAERRRLFDHFRGQWSHHLIQADVDALIAKDRLMDFTHVARTDEQRAVVAAQRAAGGNSWLPESNGYRPTADEVNEWSLRGVGHCGTATHVCIKARCRREGFDHECATCKGVGTFWPSKAHEALAERWENIDPPEGEGFQLWETTSEGSPASPVFSTLDDLCGWAADHATVFADVKATVEEWRAMLEADFVHVRVGNAIIL